jgi:quercetin dioxygenase-like cupin family protein
MGRNSSIERARPVTSGSDSRPARPLLRPVLVDLEREVASLLEEPEWADRDRNSRTVATTDRMRIVVTALRAGAELGSRDFDDTLAVQALHGALRLTIDGAETDLQTGQLATVEEPGEWGMRATSDAVVLLTVALGERDPDRRAGSPS